MHRAIRCVPRCSASFAASVARARAAVPTWLPAARLRRFIWTEASKPRLLALTKPARAESLASLLPKSVPVLDAVRSLAKLDEERGEVHHQRTLETDVELTQLYDMELHSYDSQILTGDLRLEEELLHVGDGDENARDDARDAVIEMAPGVGGVEASLFAAEMWEMYERFAERRGWRFDVEQIAEGTGGGIQSATARVSGMPDMDGVGAFGWLRSESGVHRVQRVPTTDKKGRMQTSSAVVVVMPVAGEADVTLGPSDVRIEISKKSSGPGGQSVNAAHQAIRAIHIPSGLSVHCSSSSSQFENRNRAMEMLRTKLFVRQIIARTEFEQTERKQQRGTGDRSEKIRTYNFQRDDVSDHILGKAAGVHGANDMLFGDGLDALLAAHRAQIRAERLDLAIAQLEQALDGKGSAKKGG